MGKPKPIKRGFNAFEIVLPPARVIRHPPGTRALIELGEFVVMITFKPAAISVTADDFDFELQYV